MEGIGAPPQRPPTGREPGRLVYGWHMDQAERHRRNLAVLVAHHEAEAEKLMNEGAA